MLGIAASVLAVVCKRLRQLLATRNSMQQGVQTDATSNIQQCGSCWPTKMRPFARGSTSILEVDFTVFCLTFAFVSY